MANIMGFAELLLNKDFDTTVTKSYIKEIHESSVRLANLISNFLDLSRLEINGILQFNNREEVELDWLAEKAWQQLASLNKKHKLIIEKDSNLISANVDSDALLRVFINLFSNAIKYSFNQEEILCKLNQREDLIEVAVIDQGIGIQEEFLENIFEQFFRVNCPQTKYISGTGLGLWITREIIKAHEGKIWAEKNKTQGTSIIFTLPSLKTP
jgi:two-component system sensor histidine kinase VicK